MELSDFEFSAPTLFPRHEVVHGYLDSYARHFGIIDGSEQIVQFGRTVTKVGSRPALGHEYWRYMARGWTSFSAASTSPCALSLSPLRP